VGSVPDEGLSLREVAASAEMNADGERWLKFLSSDGMSWYTAWMGDSATVLEIATSFGESVANSLVYA
jgi:hypothetical protein